MGSRTSLSTCHSASRTILACANRSARLGRKLLPTLPAAGQKAIIQLPVGCGKSGVAAILPFGISRGRVLVIAPNLTIKEELYRTLDITNRQKCFWRQRGVLAPEHMSHGPYVCTLDTGNLSVCEKSHIVVTNIQQFGTDAEKWLNRFPQDFFDLIIVDEAHPWGSHELAAGIRAVP